MQLVPARVEAPSRDRCVPIATCAALCCRSTLGRSLSARAPTGCSSSDRAIVGTVCCASNGERANHTHTKYLTMLNLLINFSIMKCLLCRRCRWIAKRYAAAADSKQPENSNQPIANNMLHNAKIY
jgi:hypothetical protein